MDDPPGEPGPSIREETQVLARRFALLVAVAAAVVLADGAPAEACGGRAYAYAGISSTAAASGISASVSPLSLPRVRQGHVAAFVGVGGPGLGPNGSDEWLQIGLSGFAGGANAIYYEVARPGRAPVYTELAGDVRPGESHRLAVLEQRGRADWWRVWLDGRPVSAPVHLPGSHGRWTPTATAESWTPGVVGCNAFSFGFERVSVATAPGGSWHLLGDRYAFNDAGYRVVPRAGGAFVATSAAGARPQRQLLSFTP
jgi:hypothetical protein